MQKPTFNYKNILLFLALLTFCSCNKDKFGDEDETKSIGELTIQKVMADYSANFGTLTKYQELKNCTKGISFSVPLKNEAEGFRSYLIATRSDDGNVSSFS